MQQAKTIQGVSVVRSLSCLTCLPTTYTSQEGGGAGAGELHDDERLGGRRADCRVGEDQVSAAPEA